MNNESKIIRTKRLGYFVLEGKGGDSEKDNKKRALLAHNGLNNGKRNDRIQRRAAPFQVNRIAKVLSRQGYRARGREMNVAW